MKAWKFWTVMVVSVALAALAGAVATYYLLVGSVHLAEWLFYDKAMSAAPMAFLALILIGVASWTPKYPGWNWVEIYTKAIAAGMVIGTIAFIKYGIPSLM